VTTLRVLLLATVMLAACVPAPASASPLLAEGDAAELAQSLAEATAEQGICYGWSIQVNDSSGGSSGLESGSNAGPGAPLGANVVTDCTKSVELTGYVSFTCDSCESEDSSSISISSTVPGGPTVGDLDDLGLDGGQLKGDKGDEALANMVGALPVIAASKGLADPVEADPQTVTPGATDRPTGTPSTPDWLRESWLVLSVCLLVIIGGICWFFATPGRRRRRPPERLPMPAAPQPVPTPDEDA